MPSGCACRRAAPRKPRGGRRSSPPRSPVRGGGGAGGGDRRPHDRGYGGRRCGVWGTVMTIMRRGDKGEGVLALQVSLRAHGHELVPDGEFGTITYEAVRRFQASHGLTADGAVGPATAAALAGPPPAMSPPLA